MPVYMKYDGVDGRSSHKAGVNVAMGDGSVRSSDPEPDFFDFMMLGDPDQPTALLLPAIQSGHEAAKRMQCAVNEDDAVVLTPDDWGF